MARVLKRTKVVRIVFIALSPVTKRIHEVVLRSSRYMDLTVGRGFAGNIVHS